jgi:siroheme synthase
VVVDGTTAAQRVVTGPLGEIARLAAATGLSSPAILYVGDVVALRERLEWFRPVADSAAYNAQETGETR